MEETFQLRLTRRDRQRFERSARANKMSLAAFLREAGREKSARTAQRAACLDYEDNVTLSLGAERNPKAFIREKLKHRREVYR